MHVAKDSHFAVAEIVRLIWQKQGILYTFLLVKNAKRKTEAGETLADAVLSFAVLYNSEKIRNSTNRNYLGNLTHF